MKGWKQVELSKKVPRLPQPRSDAGKPYYSHYRQIFEKPRLTCPSPVIEEKVDEPTKSEKTEVAKVSKISWQAFKIPDISNKAPQSVNSDIQAGIDS